MRSLEAELQALAEELFARWDAEPADDPYHPAQPDELEVVLRVPRNSSTCQGVAVIRRPVDCRDSKWRPAWVWVKSDGEWQLTEVRGAGPDYWVARDRRAYTLHEVRLMRLIEGLERPS